MIADPDLPSSHINSEYIKPINERISSYYNRYLCYHQIHALKCRHNSNLRPYLSLMRLGLKDQMRLTNSALFIDRLIGAFGSLDAARLYIMRARSILRGARQKSKNSGIKLHGFAAPVNLRFATSDWSVLDQIFIAKEYEDPTAVHAEAVDRYYRRLLDDGATPIIIDCGGNVGLAALWYTRKYPKAMIVSIEPEIENFKILQKNVAAYPNIIPIHAAVAATAGKLTLANETGAPWAWTTVRSETGDVTSVTINEILLRYNHAKAFIIKVDIEGFEADLFSRNTEWIAKAPVIVIETHDGIFPWMATAHATYAALISHGVYDFVQKGENCFCYAHAGLKQRPIPANDALASQLIPGSPAARLLDSA